MTETPLSEIVPAEKTPVIDLAQSRATIDEIDEQIVDLFERRMRVAFDVAAYKRAVGKPVLDEKREAEKIAATTARASDEFKQYVPRLFDLLMEMSRSYQECVLDGAAASGSDAAQMNGVADACACEAARNADQGSSETAAGQSTSSPAPVYGLLGRTLGHSYSPRIHQLLGGYRYSLFEVEPEDVEAFVREGSFAGINVTVSYKETVMPLCDELTDAAKIIGCVNTIVRKADGTLLGDNTDYYGFTHLLNVAGVRVANRKVLVLGTGGASKTVQAVLADQGASEIVVVSRTGAVTYENLEAHYDAQVIVNTTPVGMYPHCPAAPLDLEPFARCGELREGYADGLLGVVDVVYNPARTGLMLQAEKLGIPHASGLPMLVAQAHAAAERFLHTHIDEARIAEVTEKLAQESANIVLIGMPAGGKSTIGAAVARKLGRPFVDIDALIPDVTGKSIATIFAEGGEDAFRTVESRVTADVCKRSGQVVACGGGVVTRSGNYDALHQNGVIVLLERSVEELVSDGRPMSIAKGIPALAAERGFKYAAWADVVVENNADPETVASRVVEAIQKRCV